MVPGGENLSREKLRDVRSLDSAKIRRRKGLCVVEGERSMAEAQRTGSLLYLVESGKDPSPTGPDLPGTGFPGVRRYTLDPGLFREITGVKGGPGLLGVARIPAEAALEDLIAAPGRSCLFYLDGIQEPGNVGALIRTAWALDFRGVLLAPGTADPFSAKAVRASAGGVFHLPICGGAGPDEVKSLLGGGYSLFTALREGRDYRTVDFPDRAVLALGNEGSGFSSWVKRTGLGVGIPLAEGVDSLNVVVAGGIIGARMALPPGGGDEDGR